MIIIDLPQWMIYITWFVFINLAIAVTVLLWLIVSYKKQGHSYEQN